MDKSEKKLREQMIETCIQMNEVGINQGSSGNISVRWKEGMLITPAGIAYDVLEPEDICFMNMKGKVEGKNEVSSEWRFHLAIQKNRKDINAIVHTHSNHATALAIQEMEIPAIHYMVGVAGGPGAACVASACAEARSSGACAAGGAYGECADHACALACGDGGGGGHRQRAGLGGSRLDGAPGCDLLGVCLCCARRGGRALRGCGRTRPLRQACGAASGGERRGCG